MDETVDQGVENEVVGSDNQTGVDEAPSAGSEQDSTDWKGLYEKEHTRAENFKEAFSKKRAFVRAGATDPVVDETEDDKPILRSELTKAIRETITPIVAGNKVEAELIKQVPDLEKRKLVELYYNTRVRQMGTSDDDIRNDISAALAIADAQKLKKAAAEVTRKTNMQSQTNLSGSASEPAVVSKNNKFSAQQIAALTARAKNLGMDSQKFIETAWRNQNKG